jgi:hypothetical protein
MPEEQTLVDIANEIAKQEGTEETTPTAAPQVQAQTPAFDPNELTNAIVAGLTRANTPQGPTLESQINDLQSSLSAAYEEADFIKAAQIQQRLHEAQQVQIRDSYEQRFRQVESRSAAIERQSFVTQVAGGNADVVNKMDSLLAKFGPDAVQQINNDPNLKELVQAAARGFAVEAMGKTAPGGIAPSQTITNLTGLPSSITDDDIRSHMQGFGVDRKTAIAQIKRVMESN